MSDNPAEPEIVEVESNEADRRLKELTAGDEKMYNALGHFLLADPERQIEQLGGVDKLLESARESQSKGDAQGALVNYDYAAKIEIYHQNKEDTKKYLELAEGVTQTSDEHEMHQTLLADLDRVMKISAEYQKVRESQPKEEKIISQTEPAYATDTPVTPKEA